MSISLKSEMYRFKLKASISQMCMTRLNVIHLQQKANAISMGRLDVLIYNLVISQRQFNSRSQNLSHKTTCIYKDESKCYVFAPKLLIIIQLASNLDLFCSPHWILFNSTDIGSFIVAFLKL